MRIATNVKALHEVEALEERLQVVKWTISVPPRQRATTSTIVTRTAGLLGKRLPSGVTYQRQLRHAWAKRLHRLGL